MGASTGVRILRLIFGFFFAVSAVTIAGCEPADMEGIDDSRDPDISATTAEEVPSVDEVPTQQPLEVVETAFWRDGDYWDYFVLIENPNEDFAWLRESWDIEAIDAEGVILDSSSHWTTLFPDDQLGLHGTFFGVGDEKIVSVEVRGVVDGTDVAGESLGSFILSEPKVKNDDWQAVVSGTIESTFAEDQEFVTVLAVVRDKQGKVIDASTGYVDRVPTGGKARYEVSFWDLKIRNGRTVEVYANF